MVQVQGVLCESFEPVAGAGDAGGGLLVRAAGARWRSGWLEQRSAALR